MERDGLERICETAHSNNVFSSLFHFCFPLSPGSLHIHVKISVCQGGGDGGLASMKIHANLPNKMENWKERGISPLGDILLSLTISATLYSLHIFTLLAFSHLTLL